MQVNPILHLNRQLTNSTDDDCTVWIDPLALSEMVKTLIPKKYKMTIEFYTIVYMQVNPILHRNRQLTNSTNDNCTVLNRSFSIIWNGENFDTLKYK